MTNTLEDLTNIGVRVFSISENLELANTLTVNLFGIINEHYLQNLSWETAKGKHQAAKEGYHLGSRVPFGYRKWKPGDPPELDKRLSLHDAVTDGCFRLAADISVCCIEIIESGVDECICHPTELVIINSTAFHRQTHTAESEISTYFGKEFISIHISSSKADTANLFFQYVLASLSVIFQFPLIFFIVHIC